MAAAGCSGAMDHAVPGAGSGIAEASMAGHSPGNPASDYLCSFYEIACPPGGCEITPLRHPATNLNVLHFLEPPPLVNVQIVDGPTVEPGDNHLAYITIGLRHPLAGAPEFTGFDVKGVVFPRGFGAPVFSETTNAGGEVIAQTFHDDFLTANIFVENADGYTDLFNPLEYPYDGTWQSYVDGLLGTPDLYAEYPYTVNPYKYFADDIDANESIVNLNMASRGMFSPGEVNTRRYALRSSKPWSQVIPIFNYAVIASWEFPNGSAPWTVPDDFPPNANQNSPLFLYAAAAGTGLTTQGGSEALSCQVVDWQGDAIEVRAEAPGIFLGAKQLTTSGGGNYSLTFTNEMGATAGEYAILLTAESPGVMGKSYHLLKTTIAHQYNNDWSAPVLISELGSYYAFPFSIVDASGKVWAFWVDDTGAPYGRETIATYFNGSWLTPAPITGIPGDANDGPDAKIVGSIMYLTCDDCALHAYSQDVLMGVLHTSLFVPGSSTLPYYTVSDIAPTYLVAFNSDIEVHDDAGTEVVTLVWQDVRPQVSPFGEVILRQRRGGVWQNYINVSDDSSNPQSPHVAAGPNGELYIAWYDVLGGNWLCRWDGQLPFTTHSVRTELSGKPVDVFLAGGNVVIPLMQGSFGSQLFYLSFAAGTTPTSDPEQLTNLPTNYYGSTLSGDGDIVIFAGVGNITGHVISGSTGIDMDNILPPGYTLQDPGICIDPASGVYHIIFEGDYNSIHGIYYLHSS